MNPKTLLSWLVAVLTLLPGAARSQVVLNEIMADNSGDVKGPDGGAYDYVELYNRGSAEVSLDGWSLSVVEGKKTNTLSFAATDAIGANDYLVVWFGAKSNTPAPRALFGIGRTGGRLSLLQGQAPADTVEFGLQAKDLPISRVPNATGNWLLSHPTPSNANVRVATTNFGTQFALRLNEWLATNSAGSDKDWLEIYNPKTNGPVVLGGLIISDQPNQANVTTAPIAPLSFINSGGFFRLWCDDKTNSGPDHLPYKLSSSSGEMLSIYLPNAAGLVDRVTFGAQQRDVSMGRLPDGGTNIVYFPGTNYLTPGDANKYLPVTNVIVTEILSHTDTPFEDAIELYNPTGAEVAIGGWWLSNEPDLPEKWRIPPGATIPANGFKVFYEQLSPASGPGFNQSRSGEYPDFTINSAHGDNVVLTGFIPNPALGNRPGAFRLVRDIDSAENGVSWGRYVKSDGGSDFVPMSQRSFGVDNPQFVVQFRGGTGESNSYPKMGPLVISEIMYHPPDIGTNDNSHDEYIELTSITNGILRLYFFDGTGAFGDANYAATNTWRLRGAIDYDFPRNVLVPPLGRLLVVNFDPATNGTETAAFRTLYRIPDEVPIFGPYGGKLANGSDTIELKKPDRVQDNTHPDAGYVPYILVEKVKYEDKAPWPTNLVDGGGNALQRLSLTNYANDQINWFTDTPTPGRDNIIIRPPRITSSPVSRTVSQGLSTVMSVTVTGTPPFFFQWRRNDTNLDAAVNPTVIASNLSLVNVRGTQAGAYSVEVSNSVGVVTSAVANLTVITEKVRPTVVISAPAPNARLSNDTWMLRGTAKDNIRVTAVRYQVNGGDWYDTDGTTNWTGLAELRPGTNVVRVAAEDSSANLSVTNTRIFFRVVTSPLVVSTNGRGKVAPVLTSKPLDVGRGYRLTATPAAGWLFRNWSSDVGVLTTKPVLDFLMQSNLMLSANFVTNPFIALKGTFNGLFYQDGDVIRHGRCGYITFTLTDRGAFSGRLLLANATHPISGQFNTYGEARASVKRPGKTPLSVVLQLDVTVGSDSETVGGLVTDNAEWEAAIFGDRQVFSRTNPAWTKGYYTMVLPGAALLEEGSSENPGGHGFGTVTVSDLGVLTFKATLADGTTVSQTTTVSKQGDWPLYISLYGGKGTLIGRPRFSPSSPFSIYGLLNWIKTTNVPPSKLYTGGFSNTTPARGWAYTSPAGLPVFTYDNGEFVMASGNLALTPSTNLVAIDTTKNAIAIDPLDNFESEIKPTLKLTLKTGLLGGTFLHPVTHKATPLKGVVLRPENSGFGFFLGTNHSGAFQLQQRATEED